MYAMSGAAIALSIERSWVRLPVPFGVPSATTKYPWEAISAIAIAFDSPFFEHAPSPQTKIGYFSAPPRSVGRKIVPSLIPGSALTSTVTLCGPLPVALLPAGLDAVQVPGLPLPPLPAPPLPEEPPAPAAVPAAPPRPEAPPLPAAPPRPADAPAPALPPAPLVPPVSPDPPVPPDPASPPPRPADPLEPLAPTVPPEPPEPTAPAVPPVPPVPTVPAVPPPLEPPVPLVPPVAPLPPPEAPHPATARPSVAQNTIPRTRCSAIILCSFAGRSTSSCRLARRRYGMFFDFTSQALLVQ